MFFTVGVAQVGPAWEVTPDSLGKRGGFHKEGEGTSFGDSFVHFSSLRNGPQRSAYPFARRASLTQLLAGGDNPDLTVRTIKKAMWKNFHIALQNG